MKQLSQKGLIFFVIGIALGLVFRNSIGMAAGVIFFVIGTIFIIKNRIDLNKGKNG